MSEAQYAIQESLVARYEAIRSGTVKPWKDNALAITTDGRKLALDVRLLSPHAEDFPGSKVNALVENVRAIWQEADAFRGTQLIFSDMGVNPTAWGYSIYGEIIDKLVKAGMPRPDIAIIGMQTLTLKNRCSLSASAPARSGCSWAALRKWARAPTYRSAS
jgi:hypothetical protein